MRAKPQIPARIALRDELALVILLDIAGRQPRQVPSGLVVVIVYHNAMPRIVDEQTNVVTGQIGKLEHRYRLILRPGGIVTQPPRPLLRKIIAAIGVVVSLARSKPYLGWLEAPLGLPYGLEGSFSTLRL